MKQFIKISLLAILIFGCKDKTEEKKMRDSQQQLKMVELTNPNGMSVKFTNFGATVMSLKIPDKNGNPGEIVLGYDTPQEYLDGNLYFGATIGRYGNRIAKGKFNLQGKIYTLATNNGENHLHGGVKGFNNVCWEIEEHKNSDSLKYVKFHYLSKDGEEGYPGTLDVIVTYTLTNQNELVIDYKATTDNPTIVNLTHHSFFNLKDGGKSTILDHQLMINAGAFTPVDEGLIPTGEIRPVDDTPMDFRELTPIGARIEDDYLQLESGNGYDHNWVLNKDSGQLSFAAKVYEPVTGRIMEVYTTEPGLQFYSGNFLNGSDIGHGGTSYQFRTAFCLETQHFPDSPNQPGFPSTILKPGETYTQKTVYKFDIKE